MIENDDLKIQLERKRYELGQNEVETRRAWKKLEAYYDEHERIEKECDDLLERIEKSSVMSN